MGIANGIGMDAIKTSITHDLEPKEKQVLISLTFYGTSNVFSHVTRLHLPVQHIAEQHHEFNAAIANHNRHKNRTQIISIHPYPLIAVTGFLVLCTHPPEQTIHFV
ncbi:MULTISPECIES: hypothetical protein [Pandoraea]|uniref:hypothetical protein n=1 Tax=Pandoraea TaxID=93217 RepID=UPI0012413CF6|nr:MULTISPECIES: hypothetical protein [Pandoraea]